MSALTRAKKEDTPSIGSFSKFILPAYIAFSALFILYIGYTYFQWVVYNSGLNQGASAGQEQGYQQAIVDLMNQAGTKCEPVSLTAGDQQVDVINIACLQQAEAPTQEAIIADE